MSNHPAITSSVIYQSKSGAIEVKADSKQETVWLTQDQIASLFNVQKAAISKHLKNIFISHELKEKSVVSILETTAKDNKRYKVKHFNLDAVISIGYRVNSKEATHFRQWAIKVIGEHIRKGYTINRNRIKKNYHQFLTAVDEVKNLLPDNAIVNNEDILELVKLFADTWLPLDAYDKDLLKIKGMTKKRVVLTAAKLSSALEMLKIELIARDEATELFGSERIKQAIEGIVGNVMQSFDGRELYPSIEEKAAHLLYFIVKNHPFVDGNKRSGAYAFVWFLQQAKILDVSKMTPPALTAVTLLVAASSPKDKERMVALVCRLLGEEE